YADKQAADDVDERDEYRGHSVTLRKTNGAVHGAIELGFLADLHPTFAGFLLIDDSCVQVRVNRKLLAWQCIQREPASDFRNTNCAVVDHDVLNHDQN